MPRGILLCDGKSIDGYCKSFGTDMPTLPAEIDAKAQSLSIVREAIPALIYDQPNYGGHSVYLYRGGGCDDLSTCLGAAGNWANRIRSFKLKVASAPEGVVRAELPDATPYRDDDKE